MPYNLNIPGWMPESELKIIEQLAFIIPPNGKMVEVGPFCGRSSWCWSQSVAPSVEVICIDIWNPNEHPYHPPSKIGIVEHVESDFGSAESIDHVIGTLENFKRNTANCKNITPLQGSSPYDFEDWEDQSLDLVFLDGVHHNPVFWDDLNFWFWKLKPGGIYCGDDFARTHPDVVWGIQDFAKNHGLTYFMQGRIWMMQRPPHKNIIQTLFT